MRGFTKLALIYVGISVSLAACGGGEAEKPPVPLPHHFDEMYLAKLGPQQTVIDANSQWQVARAENAKAESDYNDAGTQLQVAKNDFKQTQLAIDSAITQKAAAEKTGDMNAVNAAQIQKSNAEALHRAAAERVKFLDAYREFARRFWLYTQENMYWREAQMEQIKANLAKANAIQPAKLDYTWFPPQVDDRGKRTQRAHDRVAKEKDRAMGAHQNWRKIQDEADKANGKPSSSWDPMAQGAPPMPNEHVDTRSMSNGGGEPPAPPQ
jgi:hypothetical protein